MPKIRNRLYPNWGQNVKQKKPPRVSPSSPRSGFRRRASQMAQAALYLAHGSELFFNVKDLPVGMLNY